jgi:hypothetical protein
MYSFVSQLGVVFSVHILHVTSKHFPFARIVIIVIGREIFMWL